MPILPQSPSISQQILSHKRLVTNTAIPTSHHRLTPQTTQSTGCKGTYHSLDQLHSLCPDLVDDSSNINNSFLLHLLQNMVYSDKRPCPTNSSTVEKHLDDSVCTCSGPLGAPFLACVPSGLSCGRPGEVWHSLVLHGLARQ